MPNSYLDGLGFTDATDMQQGDPAVWTLLGEAGKDPQGQLAVASTIANRANLQKADYSNIVTDPNQGYEAWQDSKARAKTQQSYPVGSDEYNKAAQVLSDIKSGKVQPLPYDSFYSPAGQAALKRPPPEFEDNKTGTDIGGNRFFSTGAKSKSYLDTLGFNESPGTDKGVTNAATGEPLPDVQAKAARALQAEDNGLVVNEKTGDATYHGMPFYQAKGNEQPQKPGDYWLDPKGQVHQVPVDYNGLTNYANAGLLGAGNSLMAGVQALKATGGNPFDSMFGNFYGQALSHYQGAQQAYTQEHPTEAAITQGVGNLQTVAPTLALGGEVLAPARAAMGPVGDFLAGASKGNPFLKIGSQAVNGAIQGGAASALTAGQSDKPFLQQVGEGAAAGAVLNPLVHGASDKIGDLFNGGSAEGVTPAAATLAKTAVDKYGIPLRVSQIQGVGSRAAAVADSGLIGSDAAHAANNAEQKTAFTRAVAKTFGSDADQLTPDVMDAAKRRIGGVMNDIGSRTDITNTNGLLSNLHQIVGDASQVVPETELKPLLNQVKNIADTIQGSSEGGEKLSGKSYADLVAKGSALDRATLSPNSNIRHYAQQIRNTLDNAVEAEANDDDIEAFKQARFQYKNLMTIKNLAAKANVEGEINPNLLHGAVNTNFKNRAFRGAGDLGELAQIGQTFMKEPSNSFSSERWWDKAKKFGPTFLGGAGVASIGPAIAHPVEAAKVAGSLLAGAAVKGASNAIKRASNLSPTVRNRFLDNILNGSVNLNQTGMNSLVPAGAIMTNNMFQNQQGSK